MTGITILIIMECLLLYIAYKLFHDILNPAIISITTFIISTISCIPMINLWQMHVYDETIIVIFFGLATMVLANFMFIKYRQPKTLMSPQTLYVNGFKCRIVITLCILFTLYYIYSVIKTGESIGGKGVLEAIYMVKHEEDVNVDFVAKQVQKFVFASAYIHMFILINNIICRDGLRKNIQHIIPGLCLILCVFFTGVRTEILKLLSAGIFMTILFLKNKKINIKPFLRKSLIVLVGFSFLGGSINKIFKGESSFINQNYSTAQIVAYYIGSPIQVLNLKIHNGIEKYRDKHIWGRTTFSRQYKDLDKFNVYKNKIGDNIGSVFLVIDDYNKVAANVDTILGPPLYDFGFGGMAIYIFILYSSLALFYQKLILRNQDRYRKNLNIILYSFFLIIPVMAYYACLPNVIFTFNYLIQIVVLIFLYNYYFTKMAVNKIK